MAEHETDNKPANLWALRVWQIVASLFELRFERFERLRVQQQGGALLFPSKIYRLDSLSESLGQCEN